MKLLNYISVIQSINFAKFLNIACSSFLSIVVAASFAHVPKTVTVPLTSIYASL